MKAYASSIEKYLMQNREVSRKELAKLTGLSLSAISGYVGRLIEEGVLVEKKAYSRSQTKTCAGRPFTPLALNPSLAFSVGCEVRKDRVLTEVVDIAGGRMNFLEFKGEIKDEAGCLELLFKAIGASIREAPLPGRVSSIGVCMSGSIDFGEGLVVHSPAVSGITGLPLKRILEEKFSMPVKVENNARSMGFAEIHASPDRDYKNVVFIPVGDGIGSAIILNGEIFRVGGGLGGELGHIVVDYSPQAPFCSCGNRGCLQAAASCSAMARRAGELAAEGIRTSLGNGGERITFDTLVEAAGRGDKIAMIVFDEAAEHFASGLGPVLNLLNPDFVIMGGDIVKAGEMLGARIMDLLRRRAISEVTENMRIEFSSMGGSEASCGAALLASEVVKLLSADFNMRP